jgi:phage shock protein A
MFKTVLTLFRGSVAAAGEELEDRSALLILDQQMRDAAAAVERSKRSLALAIAGDQQEGRRLDATNARIADLEVRATAHLMVVGKILPARRHRRLPISRPTATPR